MTIDLLEKTVNQTIEIDDLKKKIQAFKAVKKDTDNEIQKLVTLRNEIGLE